MTNVVPLRDEAIPDEPDPEIIKIFELGLEEARAGRILAASISIVDSAGAIRIMYRAPTGTNTLLLGSVSSAQHDIASRINENYDRDDD
jgi:hypothetical protein